MKKICVFLGSAVGTKEIYRTEAVKLGQELVKRDLALIYGGSSLGLMGLLANTVKQHGGKAIGIITEHLIDKEKPLTILDELHVVDSIQERKLRMQQMADAFIVMPGGLGTLEEAFETWCAVKTGALQKEIGFLNTDGYFDGMFQFINHCEDNGFLSHAQNAIPHSDSDVVSLMGKLLKHDD